MRTVVLGGSFDPVHVGHLFAAAEALARFDYERVLFIPAKVPPHKRSGPFAPAEDRLAMLVAATKHRRDFAVDPYELERGGVSYTVQTIRHLISGGSVTGKPGLLLGEDLAAGFEDWREADALEELADLILLRRPGWRRSRFSRRHLELANLPLDISSSEIRRRVAEGLPYRYLVTEPVYRFITRRRLYGCRRSRG